MTRLAIVEDNDDNIMLLCALLGDDYELDTYTNGLDAITGITERPPALVLLDISLPEMSGEIVLERLRAAPETRDIPVMALTAHAMAGDRERFLELGFDAYLSKPIVDDEVLFSAIRQLLEGTKNAEPG